MTVVNLREKYQSLIDAAAAHGWKCWFRNRNGKHYVRITGIDMSHAQSIEFRRKECPHASCTSAIFGVYGEMTLRLNPTERL
jgi:hypothetical protein